MLVTCITYADPLVYLKNNSDRRIIVEPLAENTTFKPELLDPEGKPKDEYKVDDTGEPITGIRIKYCPSSAGTICNTNEAEFNKAAKTTTFYFNAPNAKKYYLKLTIDKNDKVTLEAQKGIGILGNTRTSNMKYSLSDNIKTGEIKSTPARPQQGAPQRQVVTQMAPKMGISSPATSPKKQKAVANKDLPLVKERLQEIRKLLEETKEKGAQTRSLYIRLERAALMDKELKDDIAFAKYKLTKDEAALAKEIEKAFIDIENRVKAEQSRYYEPINVDEIEING